MSVPGFVGLYEQRSSTRRRHMQAVAGLVCTATPDSARAANQNVVYGQSTIPPGIRSRFVDNINGLRVHLLESGFPSGDPLCFDPARLSRACLRLEQSDVAACLCWLSGHRPGFKGLRPHHRVGPEL